MIRTGDRPKPFIDLNGPEGNAYVLLGYARSYARQLGLDADAITEEMRSSNYDNLIAVFDKYFGEIIDLCKGETKCQPSKIS